MMNPNKNSKLDDQFSSSVKSVFDAYLKNLNPDEGVSIDYDDSNIEEVESSIVGADVSPENDPFFTDLVTGLHINTSIENQQWEDLEDDAHR